MVGTKVYNYLKKFNFPIPKAQILGLTKTLCERIVPQHLTYKLRESKSAE